MGIRVPIFVPALGAIVWLGIGGSNSAGQAEPLACIISTHALVERNSHSILQCVDCQLYPIA